MSDLSRHEIWYGRDAPPSERIELRAGALAVELVDGELRYLRAGQVELVRRVFPTVRARMWKTIVNRPTKLQIDRRNDRFRVSFEMRHRGDDVDFSAQAAIEGRADGTIVYEIHGRALRDFEYCRIGLCVLYPPAEYAGRPYRATTPYGPIAGVLPQRVGPQPLAENVNWPLFPSFSSIAVRLIDGTEVRAKFEGDLFEMEDQRNWGDGSFKAYCTPLILGQPLDARAGQLFEQRVTVSAVLARNKTSRPADPRPCLVIGRGTVPLPALGFCLSKGTFDLSVRQVVALRALRPAHLRVDLHLAHSGWIADLEQAARAADALGAALEVALFVTDGADAQLRALGERLTGHRIARYLVFHEQEGIEGATSPRWYQLARERLARVSPGAAFVGGSAGNFDLLNRCPPAAAALDGFVFAFNPQVHLSDDATLVEALASLAPSVRTALDLNGHRPVIVSPVTLKPWSDQTAGPTATPDALPPSVDPRQMSLFGAAWTVGSLRALAEGRAAAATYYETIGWRGLVESEQGPPLPDIFHSRAGMFFPVYHVFADVAEMAGGRVVPVATNRPLVVEGLALRTNGWLRLLTANLTACAQRVEIGPLGSRRLTIRRLNDETARLAMFQPAQFRALDEPLSGNDGRLEVWLDPYETVRIDAR